MKEPLDYLKELRRLIRVVTGILVAVVIATFFLIWNGGSRNALSGRSDQTTSPISAAEEAPMDTVIDGVHAINGLADGVGYMEVLTNCTGCHSAQLVTQNRGDRARWEQIIRWMQETQGLWDLGEKEPVILDYLASNYPPEEINRRTNLDPEAIEWYVLKSQYEPNQ
ncbi:MAG: hypothetical protein KDC59_17095 [Saprospiraceae bacterium]|nr:hypothetical protein [Saprospiraceae bacterium]HPG06111.1 hypothetical protein [Saprospiraceae bacterium]HQU53737.1 hypothetical protein [Saprospiraceae bacterium]